MIIGKTIKSSFILLLTIMCFGLSAQTTIRGVITDDATGEVLIGANVLLAGNAEGTITDIDGTFELNTSRSLPVDLEISYTGYTSKTISATSSNIGNISLMEGILLTDEVIVSASRRREKVQEAPASVSVLTARKLEASPNATDVTRNLINTPGVQIQQQSANKINISMRGGSSLFGTSVFPIIDYRSLVGPGIGTFQSDQSGINNLDISRIEVVRGAGSALYGPGVTQGVVHFITKSPIDEPCTSFELVGGELNTFGGSFRHATKVSDKFGFKVVGSYRRGDEFTLDPDNSDDSLQIAKFHNTITQPALSSLGVVDQTVTGEVLLTGLDEDGDGNPMAIDWNNASISSTLEFRPSDQSSINLSGGFNTSETVFYNEQGEGFSDQREYWGQARGQFGGLFVQAFYLNNDGGTKENPTFLYQTGLRTPISRTQLETQVQYNFDTPGLLDANWTAGFDYRFAGQDTEGLVYGRQEDDDDFSVVGGYLQGKFALGSKFDVVLAGRFDQFNFIDQSSFSPRAAIVYKAAPNHTFRASFNRATTTVSNLQLNIDFPLSAIIPASFDVWLKGNKTPQIFGDSPMIEWFTGIIPGMPVGTPGAGLPLGAILAQPAAPGVDLNTAVQGGILAAIMGDPATAPLAPAVQAALGNISAQSIGFGGALSPGFNIFDGSPLGLLDAPISEIATHDSYEIGYKGLIGDKLGASLDIYRITQDGNSQFTAISPAYTLLGIDGLANDLGNNAESLFTPAFIAALQAGGFDIATATAIAGQVAPSVNGAYAGAGGQALNTASPAFGGATLTQVLQALPFHATVETEQVPQGDGISHLAAGYRTFNERTFYGWDLGLEYYLNENITMFGNYSGVNKVDFMQTVRGQEDAGELPSSLNIPKNKFRLGFNYTPLLGFRANVAFQHDDSFDPIAGQYSGDTGDRNLVDAGIGFKFDSGLQIDLTATNLLNNEYRYYQNMPFIGRRALVRLKYDLCGDGPSDQDGDGVKDSKDMCPNVPGLKAFQGCPDSDADGIKDGDDNCPMAAGDALNGGCPDSDGDGVIDNDDKCPNVAGTLMGCPDADGDGLADGDDMCPSAAGTLNGCPDGDGDGVADKDDKCPNDAGNVMGCPDNDGDGVADGDDKCPTIVGDGSDGCPSDSDGDGVPNDRDACPDTAGPANGCPDSDNDGVADKDDRCPKAGGDIDSNGCPKIKPVPAATTAVFSRALKGIQFETGKAVIKSESFAVLNEIAGIMSNDQALKLIITGHTDNVGDENRNLDLSINRANAVKKYLETKGISTVRLVASGQGEYSPIADNSTREGRAQNRRVELSGKY